MSKMENMVAVKCSDKCGEDYRRCEAFMLYEFIENGGLKTK